MARTRLTWEQRRERLSGTLWVMPLVVTTAALLLGFLLGLVRLSPDGPLNPVLFHGDAEEARRLLLSVATATVGVFAVVIGLTLVALQVAASRYSPRLVRVLLRDRPTQLVLSLFIATFAYNAAGLYTVGDDASAPDDYPRLAVTVGLGLLLVCVAALVYYVDRVVHSIQIHTILVGIGVAAKRAIAAGPPGIGGDAGRSAPGEGDPPPSAVPLVAPGRSGYVQRLQLERVLAAAQTEDVVVRLAHGVGGHVIAGNVFGWMWRTTDGVPPAPEPMATALARSMTLGAARSSQFDAGLGLIQIVDIALLSMHVFDFHTVVQATDELTVVLSRLAAQPLGPELVPDAAGVTRVVVPAPTFEDYLDLAFGEIRRRGAGEPVVFRALIAALREITSAAGPERRALIGQQLEMVGSTAERTVHEPHDLELVLRDAESARAVL